MHAKLNGGEHSSQTIAVNSAWHTWRVQWDDAGMRFWRDYTDGAAPYFDVPAHALPDWQFNEPGYNVERANDGDLKTRWASDYGARSGWLEIDLGEEKEIGRAWISEIEWPETQEFAIEVKQGDAWRQVAHGTTIGSAKEINFAPVKARRVRLNILKAKMAININEFQVFPPGAAQDSLKPNL